MKLNINNLSNIELNYPYVRKEVCEILQVENKTGKARDLQDNEFKKYFDYYTTGNKKAKRYIITKILNKNQIIRNTTKKKIKSSKYQDHSQILLANYIASNISSQNNCINTTYLELANNLNLVNDIVFSSLFSSKADLLEDYLKKQFNELRYYNNFVWEINLFRYYVFSKIKKILATSLKALQNRCVLTYKEETFIHTENKVFKATTTEDFNNIKKSEKYALEKLNLKTKTSAIKYHFTEFYKLVSEYQSQHFNWQKTSQRILIYSCDELINGLISDYTIQPIDVTAINCDIDIIEKNSKQISIKIQNSLKLFPDRERHIKSYLDKYHPCFGKHLDSHITEAEHKTQYTQDVWDRLNVYIESLINYDELYDLLENDL